MAARLRRAYWSLVPLAPTASYGAPFPPGGPARTEPWSFDGAPDPTPIYFHPPCLHLHRNLTIEQVERLEEHFNAVPVAVSGSETAADRARETILGDAESDPGAGAAAVPRLDDEERQRMADAARSLPPLAQRVRVSPQACIIHR